LTEKYTSITRGLDQNCLRMNNLQKNEKLQIEKLHALMCIWADSKESWILPQFFTECGMGWTELQKLIEKYPVLKNEFELLISKLCEKWLVMSMKKNSSNFPKHVQTMVKKYLHIYDSFSLDVEAKNASPVRDERTYSTENYSKVKLKGKFKELYDANLARKKKIAPSQQL
jgi:hypothetical protein